MRVTLITDAPFCFDIRIQRKTASLLKLGYEITVIDSGFEHEKSESVLPQGVRLLSPELAEGKVKSALSFMRGRLLPMQPYQKKSAWMVDTLKATTPDIIHCATPQYIEAAQIVAHELKAKLVYEAYEYWPEYLYAKGGRIPKDLAKYLYYAEKNAFKSIDCFITTSEPYLQWYKEEHGFKQGEVIYNSSIAANVDIKLKPFEPPLKIVFSGNLFKSRNVALLIEAANLVNNPLQVVISGDGPEKSFLYEHAKSLKFINAEVTFVDAIPPSSLIEFLSQFDAGIHLTEPDSKQSDGSVPSKYFDYMASGLMLISPDTSGVRSLNNQENYTVLLPELEKQALADVIDELGQDYVRINKLRDTAFIASKEYSAERADEQVVEIYSKLAADKI